MADYRRRKEMANKLDRIGADLEKARVKRDEWERRVKELEQKYQETENTMIHEMVHAANLTPEQLAQIIRMAATQVPGEYPETITYEGEDKKYED